MQSKATSPEAYLDELPPERREALGRLRQVILDNLPEGFEETMSYGMIGYVVPHSVYPAGYHCNPKQPLPFMSIASQKNFIALYHMGIYVNEDLMSWFVEEYKRRVPTKLDMGKSCIRFKKVEHIPYDLIGELVQKMSVEEWVALYEAALQR